MVQRSPARKARSTFRTSMELGSDSTPKSGPVRVGKALATSSSAHLKRTAVPDLTARPPKFTSRYLITLFQSSLAWSSHWTTMLVCHGRADWSGHHPASRNDSAEVPAGISLTRRLPVGGEVGLVGHWCGRSWRSGLHPARSGPCASGRQPCRLGEGLSGLHSDRVGA